MPVATNTVSAVFALTQIKDMIQRGTFPRVQYLLLLVAVALSLHLYMTRIELGGSFDQKSQLATLAFPVFVYLASGLLNESCVVPQNLGSSLGIVHQYRMDTVLDRMRKLVRSKQVYENQYERNSS